MNQHEDGRFLAGCKQSRDCFLASHCQEIHYSLKVILGLRNQDFKEKRMLRRSSGCWCESAGSRRITLHGRQGAHRPWSRHVFARAWNTAIDSLVKGSAKKQLRCTIRQ